MMIRTIAHIAALTNRTIRPSAIPAMAGRGNPRALVRAMIPRMNPHALVRGMMPRMNICALVRAMMPRMNTRTLGALLLCLIIPVQTAAAQNPDILCVSGLQNDAIVLAGTARSGIYRSVNGGGTWQQTSLREGTVPAIASDPRSVAHWYAGTSRGLYASTDSGATWWPVDPSIAAKALLISAAGPRLLLAADGAVVRRTTDDGKSWSTIEALSPYGIRLLSQARTDSGAVYIAACDTAILISSAMKEGVWTKIPSLPSPSRITAIVCDTLSATGLQLCVGSSTGVFMYSIAHKEWRLLGTGLPQGPVSAMGTIAYDTTRSSRSYSLCVSVENDRSASPTPRSAFYKLSSVSGVLDSSSAWNMIADEHASIRDCFMPDKGANRGKIYLAVSDGLRISFDGGTTWRTVVPESSPIASVASRYCSAGIVAQGGRSRMSVRIGSRGGRALTLRVRSITDSKNFTVLSTETISVPPGEEGAIDVAYAPMGWGKHTARMIIETDDPQLQALTIDLAGFSTGMSAVRRTVAIDRSHGGMSASSYAQIKNAFTMSGMVVVDSLASPAEECAMILLPGPTRAFTAAEAATLAQAAAHGASIVVLARAEDQSASVANALLSDPAWKADVPGGIMFRFGSARIVSTSGPIAAAKSFALRSAPYLAHASRFGFASATEIVITGSGADTLCAAQGVMRIDASGAHADGQAALGAVAGIGRGKVIAIGDPAFWSTDSTGGGETGLWGEDNFAAALSIASTIEQAEVRFPSSVKNEEYMLFSIPSALADRSIGSVFRAFGKPDPYQWRLFGAWNGESETYSEYPSPVLTTIDRGKGYWLIAKSAHEITPGSAVYRLIEEPFTMTLKPGFTLIGDPFPFAVDWRTVITSGSVEPAVWGYHSAEFVSTTVMRPYGGYFVCNPSDSDAVVTVMPIPLAETQPLGRVAEDEAAYSDSIPANADGEWTLHVSATDGSVHDRGNECGMRRTGAELRDAHDRTEPPVPPGRFIAFRFTHGDRSLFARDYRPVNAEGAYWNCEIVASAPGSHVSLALSSDAGLPAGFTVWILDYETERLIECAGDALYDFTMNAGETRRALRIITGTPEFIGRHTDGIPAVPLSYGLEQNFPNPWNPATTIRYTIAHSGEVRLDVYSLLGQKVRTLDHGLKSIGSHTCEWDGRDEKGAFVSSGVYLYRLTTQAYTATKRMVLMR